MRYLYGLGIVCCLVMWSSCRNDFETVPSTGSLEFSKDTVYLDTVFSNIGSSTYNLKVYNRSDEDINIPMVRLAEGEASNYRLNVDGMPGKIFENVQILAKDSIFIFIETTFNVNNLPENPKEFLYTDQLLFDTGGNQQKVELVTLIKDAVFLFPEKYADGTYETLTLGTGVDTVEVRGFFLEDSELTFTNEKPYVIYGYAAVPGNKTLSVEAGARVHFHNGAGIIVAQGGSIQSIGAPSSDPEALENEIIFEGDRLEPGFAKVPGQWLTIWLTEGSVNNEFKHTTIKNSTVGLLVDNSPVILSNVQIYNNANIGLLARNSLIIGENMVINNSGQSSLAIQLGGNYEFRHCTFANYWTGSFRSFPSVSVDNTFKTETDLFIADLIKADFINCIIYGNERRELSLYQDTRSAFNFKFENSLIHFEDPTGEFSNNPLYDFSNPALYPATKFNLDPVFKATEMNNFNIETGASGADGIGKPGVLPLKDLNGVDRSNPRDAGVYESIEF
ncbi:right-handed parallel beta-helix repeat-containing protein [Aequorivita sp. SDUM287046]|uniref:Right-handed parallel beta-helix repeat-containing protein n=1 Tax=Aequorivita aurantiaca TaxID=3053356 RepID=A0ABT8DIW6_9FLAO|nr:right-handed parallel beta-helix repeat-containing protein [Aequorivita aurantiaca]MDN3723850.1 right-handed parallel beta-helix repeat-containing protein [Aequorivita aurantiaca]